MDKAPENLSIGAINPYALTETLLGRKIDWKAPESAKIISEVLGTDYNQLFDMKFNSPLYTGLKLNGRNAAEPARPVPLPVGDTGARVVTPELSPRVIKTGVKTARPAVLNPVLNQPVAKITPVKSVLNQSIFEYTFNINILNALGWTPANCTWRDMGDFYKDVTEFSDPVQGAVGNCYFIAALAAVAWADPNVIVHRNRATGTGETDRVSGIQFYSKAGGKDAATKLVEVRDHVIVNSSSNQYVYCRSNDNAELWPALYEKAFAKWITGSASDMPDITQTAYGDPAKATAQINGKTPYYFNTNTRSGDDLYQIVRAHSMSYKTIHPMTAWTYGSGNYAGSNIVANHAYTILGWAYKNGKSYVVLRNPWGQTEPSGLNTYQGMLSFFDKSFWRPVTMIGNDGVFALEASAFQQYFACIGVAK
ncbi:MAG: hypothetical protein INR69_08950 [Mucilaginibacter polytrichastri]|nr:hypothetical protein [Mucilaginibacter polytrichastri]